MERKEITEALIDRDDFFTVEGGATWVRFQFGKQNTYVRDEIDSRKYRQSIQQYCKQVSEEYPNKTFVDDIVNHLECYTANECEPKPLYMRTGNMGKVFCYDLGADSGKVVGIIGNKNGKYRIISNKQTNFKNPKTQQAQVTPRKNNLDVMDLLDCFPNVSKEYGVLFVVALITCFIPNIKHPIILLHGEAGHGKTITSTLIKKLIDPGFADNYGLNRIDSIPIILQNNYLTVFDNVSRISEPVSDLLCRAVTGSTEGNRTLFTNADLYHIPMQGNIVLNSIGIPMKKEDIFSRSMLFHIELKDEDRMVENDLFKMFEKNRADYLDVIFRTISKSMPIYSNLNYKPISRMSDFEEWGIAIAKAIGKEKAFCKQFIKMLRLKTDEAVNNNTMIIALLYFMRNQEAGTWYGLTSKLYEELEQIVYKEKLDRGSYPKSATSLGINLGLYKYLLKEVGITFKRNHIDGGSKCEFKYNKIKD